MIDKNIYKLNSLDKYLDKNFVNNLMYNIFLAHEIVLETPVNPDIVDVLWPEMGMEILSKAERDSGSIEAIVGSVVQQAGYDPKCQNYLWIASSILNKIANKHTLLDGNKRTSLEAAMQILSSGLFIDLEWDTNDEKYKKFILSVIDNWKNKPEDYQINFIENFLNKEVIRQFPKQD